MSLSPEAIFNQSVLSAALFLTIISVPKLFVLTVWHAHKLWVFQNLDSIARSRALQMAAAIEGTPEQLKKETEDSRTELKTAMQAYRDFTKSVRDPLIESSVAAIILFLLIPIFSGIALWLTAVLITVLGITVLGLALTVALWRNRALVCNARALQCDVHHA